MSELTTLEKIMENKQKNSDDIVDEVIYESETLGAEIVIKKRPLSVFMDIIKEVEGQGEIMAFNYLLHAFLPIFQEPDGVKMALEYYRNQGHKIATPRELPEYVFEGNLVEMGEIVEIISSFYNLDEIDADIKN